MKRTPKPGKRKKRVWFSPTITLEWRPGEDFEFPAGLKEELDDIEKFDARWRSRLWMCMRDTPLLTGI